MHPSLVHHGLPFQDPCLHEASQKPTPAVARRSLAREVLSVALSSCRAAPRGERRGATDRARAFQALRAVGTLNAAPGGGSNGAQARPLKFGNSRASCLARRLAPNLNERRASGRACRQAPSRCRPRPRGSRT